MTTIVVLYDGITNSVFQSQVLEPILQEHRANPARITLLISFESTAWSTEKIQQYISHAQITVIILKKLPFIGTVSLRHAARQLKKFLAHQQRYTLRARGPLAGWICQQAATINCSDLTIQARGLLTQEYLFTHQSYWWLKKIVHTIRAQQFFALEYAVYSSATTHTITTHIEAVSPALKQYLIATFDAPAHTISVATHDLPAPIAPEQRMQWRTETRAELHIAPTSYVYCYNGSAKPWQCPQETIDYFVSQLHAQADSMLLVLTQDVDFFTQLLRTNNVDQKNYRVLQVPHQKIYRYLAAADTGILIREHQVINWTSRPTKALEYEALGLAIHHNQTIAWLTDPDARVHMPPLHQQSQRTTD